MRHTPIVAGLSAAPIRQQTVAMVFPRLFAGSAINGRVTPRFIERNRNASR
jgi:hypothetical protein